MYCNLDDIDKIVCHLGRRAITVTTPRSYGNSLRCNLAAGLVANCLLQDCIQPKASQTHWMFACVPITVWPYILRNSGRH